MSPILKTATRFLLLLGAFLIAPAYSETSSSFHLDKRNINFELTSIQPSNCAGFYPVKIQIVNNENQDSEWIVIDEKTSASHIIAAPKNKTTTHIIYLSQEDSNVHSYRSWRSDSLTLREQNGSVSHSFYFSSDSNYLSTCSSFYLPNEFKENEEATGSSTKLEAWPADWRTYSSFRNLVLSQEEYEKLNPSYKNAISQWVTNGGRLFLLRYDPAKKDKKTFDSRERQGWGSITLVTAKDPKTAADVLEKKLLSSTEPRLDLFPALASDTFKTSIPSLILILMLIAFAVLVGPLSLYVWAPVQKRHRLFILLPAFSLGFSVLLFLLILTIDGTGGKGQRSAFIYLNPEMNMATIKQEQRCRTGLLAGASFNLDEKIAFSSTTESGDKRNQKKSRQGDLLWGDWFTSRSTINQQLLSVTPSRARITIVSQDPSHPIVQSTLPCPVTGFVYKDAEGNCWEAMQVSPGSKTPLNPMTPQQSNANEKMEKDSFKAKGSDNTLAPIDTLKSIKWENDRVFFFGPVSHE